MRRIIPALLVLATAAIYVPRLQNAPLYLSHDEVIYSLQAHALATTGHDLSGRFLPMYIEYLPTFGRPTWDQPMLIYAIAATLKVLPFAEHTIRLPMVFAAILDVLLLYFVARALFESEGFAIAAAALLALTPAHFMHARTAIDFQLSLPFILGWLLCVVRYLRRESPHLLLIAGVILGTSFFGYVAAYVLVPIFALVTCGVLFGRRHPWRRYVWLAAGIALPVIVCLPWMLRFPLPFRDVVAHYAVLTGPPSKQTGFLNLIAGFVVSSRLREIPSLYWTFWDPAFLFVTGPRRFRGTQLVGMFLVALAGALIIGVIYALRRRSTDDLLLLAGLLTGPFVASLGGEAQAVWRTLQLAPFGALLAVVALRQASRGDTTRAGRAAIVGIFAVGIGLAAWYHDSLPFAQGLVRAATVPIAVMGFAVVLRHFYLDRVSVLRIAGVSALVLVSTHAAYVVADRATSAGVVLIGAICLAFVFLRSADRLGRRPLVAIALLAIATSQFMYVHVDYIQVRRIGWMPASVLVLAARLVLGSIALAAVLTMSRLLTGDGPARLSDRRRAIVAALAVVAIQVAYFWIDAFADYRVRGIQAAVVVAAVIGVAALTRGVNLGRIAIAGLFGLASIQFTTFYVDYFTGFQSRGSGEIEGNVRGAFESVIERTRERPVANIYLGRIGYGELYWKFYLIKHHREDLLTRTIPDPDVNPDRIRALPGGSVVITGTTKEIDPAIDDMAAAGVLSERQLLSASEGAPIFWLLVRSEHR